MVNLKYHPEITWFLSNRTESKPKRMLTRIINRWPRGDEKSPKISTHNFSLLFLATTQKKVVITCPTEIRGQNISRARMSHNFRGLILISVSSGQTSSARKEARSRFQFNSLRLNVCSQEGGKLLFRINMEQNLLCGSWLASATAVQFDPFWTTF